MKLKIILLFTLLFTLLVSVTAKAQEIQEKYILVADKSYGKEIIQLPVEWAPGMNLEGFEELRFSPSWKDPDSPDFWSLVLSWNVIAEEPLTVHELEANLHSYFDGLMKPNHWATDFPAPILQLRITETNPNGGTYTGEMRYFDGFHTGKVITTRIKAEQFHCAKTDKTIVLFRMSPQQFDHEVWDGLNAITHRTDYCSQR